MRNVCVSDYFKPCGDCDYECLREDMTCPMMEDECVTIMENICESELAFYIVPNYCGAPCANYYAFNERSVGWFNGDKFAMDRYMAVRKRFIIISNSCSETFEEAMRQQTFEKPDILYLSSRNYARKSVDGNLIESAEAKRDLEMFLHQDSL